MPLLEYIFVKRNVRKNGRGFCAFSSAITSHTILDPRFKARNLSSKEDTIARLTTEAVDIAEVIRFEPGRTADSV